MPSRPVSALFMRSLRRLKPDTPFSAIRQAYAAPLDTLVKLAGQDRDVNLLARLHAVLSILEAEDDAAGQKDMLIAQVYQVEKMLQDRASRSKPAAKGIIAGQQTPAPTDMPPSQAASAKSSSALSRPSAIRKSGF